MPKTKLAQSIAEQIEREILEQELRPGDSLGTELELLARFKSSRSVMREAIMLVEKTGLAEVQRGKIGGLIVREASTDAIADLLRSYLEIISSDDDIENLITVRMALEEAATIDAADKLGHEDLSRFQAFIEQFNTVKRPEDHIRLGVDMLRQILQTAGNPCIAVFSLALSTLSLSRMSMDGRFANALLSRAEDLTRCRMQQMKAVIALDIGAAIAASRQNFHILQEVVATARSGAESDELKARPDLVSGPSISGRKSSKLAEKVAADIKDRVLREHLKHGDRLGSEAKLLAEHAVGRGVLREAIRMLERLSLVTMSRGKGGGLRVLDPNPDAIIREVSNLLIRVGVTHDQLLRAGECLDLLSAGLAARRYTAANRGQVENLVEGLAGTSGGTLRNLMTSYYLVIGELSGNRSVSVLLSILANLVTLEEPNLQDQVRVQAVFPERMKDVVDAIMSNDEALARRNMLLLRRSGAKFRILSRDAQRPETPPISEDRYEGDIA